MLVDARLWQESHGEIEARARPNTEIVYISKPVDVAIYLHEKANSTGWLAAIESINLLFHGSPYDADGNPIDKDDEQMASKAASIEVLGARLSVKPEDVAEMVGVTQSSTAADKHASREKYPEYWELRDAMVALWYATTTKKAPFYLYACNLARIAGFKELFRGFDRRSTDVTGPPPHKLARRVGERGRRGVGGGGRARGGRGLRPPRRDEARVGLVRF